MYDEWRQLEPKTFSEILLKQRSQMTEKLRKARAGSAKKSNGLSARLEK